MYKKIIISSLIACSSFAADYKIDTDHSNIGFKIKHLAISKVPGRFTDFTGTFSFDPADISKSKTEALIKIASINTEQKKRDEHLQSSDFFDLAKFPEMKFVSKEVTGSGQEFDVKGDLTIRDVTKPVTLKVVYEGSAKDPWGNDRAGFTATTKINRKDFGLTWNKVIETGALVVGEDVEITIEVEGIKQP